MSFIIRLLAIAALFCYGFPAFLPGVAIHGTFWPQGIICALLFVLTGLGLGMLLLIFTIGTLGLGYIVIILLQALIPVLQLQLMSYWFPNHLMVSGWEAATIGGLCIFVLNWVLNRVLASR